MYHRAVGTRVLAIPRLMSMDTSTARSITQLSWTLDAIFKTGQIPPDVQQHLVKVYATLTAAVVWCAATCATVIWLSPSPLSIVDNWAWISLANILFMIGCLVWFFLEPSHKCGKRFLILMLMSSSNGIMISAIVAIALRVGPFIIVMSFRIHEFLWLGDSGGTALYLYLGALLSSALSTLIFIDAVNVFTWSAEFFDVQLLCGLVLFCLYVIFDTQMIIERASLGDKDAIKHSLDLFLDFISLFIRIVMILIKLKEGDNTMTTTPNRAKPKY